LEGKWTHVSGERLNLVKECIEGIKEEINELIKENGSEMYEGVFDVINELENNDDYWIEFISELEEDYNDEDDDSFINMILGDCIDRELMSRFGKRFGENLIKLGYKYDGEGWDLKDKNYGGDLTFSVG
jgi:RNA processing factor Prp31